ncbi:LysR substrate-binding domain-containing protein, partial [Romboutsia timonensis]|uniref:LysR substrate-binding domain-containing protein n=1 Tax=Romboutsia timonensis TaxID=1776391 RepID=UPI002A817CAD
VIMEVDNVATIKELVSLNLGITVIAHSACRDDVNAGRLCAIPIENSSMVRQITIVRHKDFSHQAFIGQIQAVYHRLRR